ncbi:MAG: hypothetical protein LBS20_10905 [Prevotella sp.]|jgi:phosphatidylserine/phosphatidylglycerophosphate/cardiolipin synthase-like enzyme|nr:hypothetical protein [Prevotella sp.]
MKKNELDSLFPDGLKPGLIIPYVHKGKWAIHELLPILLEQTGTAAVRIATFNISEDSLRPLFFLVEKQKVSELRLLLDMNVKRHKIDLLLFAANITSNVRLSSTHMKVMLIENEHWNVGVVGSANMNNNPRYEAGFIFTDTNHYRYFRNAFTEAYENDSLPFNL